MKLDSVNEHNEADYFIPLIGYRLLGSWSQNPADFVRHWRIAKPFAELTQSWTTIHYSLSSWPDPHALSSGFFFFLKHNTYFLFFFFFCIHLINCCLDWKPDWRSTFKAFSMNCVSGYIPINVCIEQFADRESDYKYKDTKKKKTSSRG